MYLEKSPFFLLLLLSLANTSCKTASEHAYSVNDAMQANDQNLTVGKVQKEIRTGMSGAEVAVALGSPNIVTTDNERREVWVYDKISTQTAFSRSEGGVSFLVLGGALLGNGLVGGGITPGYSSGSGASATQQRTLTVIVKFDKQKKVRDFAYHTSRF